MSIKRYNQGFGGFGPLEQCDDGKLVKYAHVKHLFNKLTVHAEYAEYWLKKYVNIKNEYMASNEKMIGLMSDVMFYKVISMALGVVVGLLVIALVVK
jgi:hypothetical protein